MPSIAEPYTLTQLPRIADLHPSSKCIVSNISDSHTQVIDVGISRSTIASYILKPTPKLIWSYSLSPSTIVDCMAVFTGSNVDVNYNIHKKFIIGLSERNNNKLCIISTINDNSVSDEVEEDEQKVFSIGVSNKIISVDIDESGEYYKIIYINGDIEYHKFEMSEKSSAIWKHENKFKKNKVLFVEFIKGFELGLNDDVILIIESHSGKTITKLYSYNTTAIIELNSIVMDSNDSVYTYNSGILYRYINTGEIITYNIRNFKISQRLELNLSSSKNLQHFTILSPAPHRIIISDSHTSYMINLKYNSVLDILKTDDELYWLKIAAVNGDSMKTTSTFGIGLTNENNNAVLNVINVDVGFGNLSESLGKSILNYSIHKSDDLKFNGLPDLVNDSFIEEAEMKELEMKEVFKKLKQLRESKNLAEWDYYVVNYLKNQPWSELSKSTPTKFKNFKIFEVEKDRIIDSNFIFKIIELIFESVTSELNAEFIPEYTLTYLFTNPLFPIEYTKGLLNKLKDHPRLLRQAIVTCPNLPYEDMIYELTIENNDIFNDILIRLSEEFSLTKITKSTIDILSQKNFNLEKILKKCLENDNGWTVFSALIDAGGLFSLSEELINELLGDVESQISSLSSSSMNLSLVKQCLVTGHSIHEQEIRKPNKKVVKNGIIDSNNKFESILNLNSNKKYDNGIEISKKIPVYSIEKLVL